MGQNNLISWLAPHELTPAQVDQLFRMIAAGLQCTTGQITMDEVQRQLGKPKDIWHIDGDSYMYDFGDFGGNFDWHPDLDKNGGRAELRAG